MRGQFYDIVPFWCDDPTMRKVYSVTLPREKEMQFQFYQGECASSMRYENDRKVYTFAKNNMMPVRREPNMVDLYDAAPKLMMSSTPHWKDKSLWFHKTNEDYGSFAPLPEARQKVNELIRGKKTEMEKIAVLTHWVADNIRYAGITMGKGEGFTLHNTKMNYTDRCGVCKDIAGSLISFLRMAGSLSGHDYGRKSGGKYTRRPFQPLCCSGKIKQRYLYAFRPDLGALLPGTLEQCRTTAKLPPRCTGRFGSLYYACFRSRKPLFSHQSQ